VEFLPKDARRLTHRQMNHLKEQLKFLPGYEQIERYEIAFVYFSALFQGTYGNVFYFAMGTNPWERVYKIEVDRSIALEKKEPKKKPVKRPRRKRRSKYDPIIDQFLEGGQDWVEIDVKGKLPNYVQQQLRRRIQDRNLGMVTASTKRGLVYLRARTSI